MSESPRPWRTAARDDDFVILDADGNYVGETGSPDKRTDYGSDNAEHIVRCVNLIHDAEKDGFVDSGEQLPELLEFAPWTLRQWNAHEKLVALAKDIVEFFEANMYSSRRQFNEQDKEWYAKARTALALAPPDPEGASDE